MKKVLKIVGIVVAALIAILLGVAGWIQFTDVPHYSPQSVAVTLPTDSANLAVGKRIVEERCSYCHLGDDGKLSGRLFSPPSSPFGEIWSRNITQDKEKGIGTYTDGQLAYLLRTGINRHGDFIGPYMSSPTIADADIASIIAYLRSNSPLVQPSQAEHPKTNINFLVKTFLKLGLYGPYTYSSKPVLLPTSTDALAYGKYLATARYECATCHSKNFQTNNAYEPEKSEGYFGGGNEISDNQFAIKLSPNITMSKNNGIGSWTKEQFITALRKGERPDGKVLSAAMPRMTLVDDAELDAIWKYLQTVPVLENQVQR